MVNVGLWVRVQAKPGRERDLAEFLTGARSVVEDEPETVAWFAVQLDESTFAIFDAFPDDAGRRAHLVGGVGKALAEKGPELLREPPSIEYVDVLASKLPGRA
ncbi:MULTISPECIES: putative quinol monooxygenase [Streptomyces]|jgi:quinol monooxygenase YgiN|uniref:putative quinol monooxygenase n=1 Tax=Streptomyces TaxID=1883 RepID=UPI0015EF9570|nr:MULTISPECIES: antibiotic biosynthesis monooxygenase [Streptomyces]KAF5991435.1 antibiotic biosynthesis monooxygenase [Streptomyces sp. WAC00263]MCX4426668.1 antibiotic biosynthesis monooxygenase [Streptomyces mirabilis]MCZ0997278.1 antibiotic biosynthesis monooxygenase [Streptomyces mirabilis]